MLGLLRFTFKLSGVGLAGLAVASVFVKATRRSRGDATTDDIDLVSVWGGTEIESIAPAFRGGSILTWWGGTNLDLRGASLDHDWAYINIKNIFGGTSIIVPEHWRVELRGRALAGGIDGPSNADLPADAPLLDIDAFAVFGGISVMRKAD